MFEDYPGSICLDEVIKEKYHYDVTNLMSLANQDFIELEGNGKDALCWITYNHEKYLFKPLQEADYNVWGELLSEEIAKILDIPCAEYRVASLNNQKGVISKNFLKNEDILLIGSEIYQNFFNEIHYGKNNDNSFSSILPNDSSRKKYIFRYLNNLHLTTSILENNHNINIKDTVKIKKSLTKMLLFDLITLQYDRHPNNWGIIQSENNFSLSPLYDNSVSFGLGYPFLDRRIESFRSELANSRLLKDRNRINSFIYQNSPNFTFLEEDLSNIKGKKKTIPYTFFNFLTQSDEITQNWIISVLSNIKEDTIETIIKRLENKFNMKMQGNLYYYIVEIFNINLLKLKEIVEEYRKENNKNEVPRNSKTI